MCSNYYIHDWIVKHSFFRSLERVEYANIMRVIDAFLRRVNACIAANRSYYTLNKIVKSLQFVKFIITFLLNL